jgi:hypothetical protein
MTFAELVIKFETQGDSSTKTSIRAVEAELKNVSNASVNASNKFQQSFGKISTSIRSVNFNSLNSQFSQMSTAMTPAMSSLQGTVTTLSLLKLALKDSSVGKFSKDFTIGIFKMQNALLDFQHKRAIFDVPKVLGKMQSGYQMSASPDGGMFFRPKADATIAERLAFDKLFKKLEIARAAKQRLDDKLNTTAGHQQIQEALVSKGEFVAPAPQRGR